MSSTPRVRLNASGHIARGERTLLLRDEDGGVTPPGKKARARGRREAERGLRAGFEDALECHLMALEAANPESPREDLVAGAMAHARAVLERRVAREPRFQGPLTELASARRGGLPAARGSDSPSATGEAHGSQAAPHPTAGGREKVILRAEPAPLDDGPPEFPAGVAFGPDFRVGPGDAARLRRYFPEVALHSPRIPPNTGTVARLCGALCARLHLVEPLGFDVSEKAVRRAGLDYWDEVEVTVHGSLAALVASRPHARLVLVETGGSVSPSEFTFEPGDLLVFGSETTGLPEDFVTDALAGRGVCEGRRAALLTIPMFSPRVRSINLANSVAMALFAAVEDLRPRVEEAGSRATALPPESRSPSAPAAPPARPSGDPA